MPNTKKPSPTMSSEPCTLIDKVVMPHVLDFISDRLSRFDTSTLEWIKLLPLHGKAILHGCCTYPVRTRPRARSFKSGYRIRASVNVEMPPPFKYIHWGRVPCKDFKQGWYSGETAFVFQDLEECAVHTLAHECFHFLSHSRQVNLKNTEANANWMADEWLVDFKHDRI